MDKFRDKGEEKQADLDCGKGGVISASQTFVQKYFSSGICCHGAMCRGNPSSPGHMQNFLELLCFIYLHLCEFSIVFQHEHIGFVCGFLCYKICNLSIVACKTLVSPRCHIK